MPDFERLQEIAEEAQRLEREDGSLTPGDYERLLTEAKAAADNDDDLYEFVVNRAPS
jgi:hypothetical protein